MDCRFIGQPFRSTGQLGEAVLQALGMDDPTGFSVASAWVQTAGVRQLEPAVKALRAGGGRASLVVGADHGVATREGIELAAEVFDEVLLFHDTGHRTFHPKLFLVERAMTATVLVGSGNLTQGGLFTNYEAAFSVTLDLSLDPEARILADVSSYFDTLRSYEGQSAWILDADSIGEIVEHSGLRIGSEADRQHDGDAQGDREPAGAVRVYFGDPIRGLAGAPALTGSDRPARSAGARTGSGGTGRSPGPAVVETWWKELSRSDVGRRPQGHQRATVTMTKSVFPINQATYFRERLFADLAWRSTSTRTGRAMEEAIATFAVVIDGDDLGEHTLSLSYAAHRAADQRNYTTTLKWESLANEVSSRNLIAPPRFLVIEKQADGSLALRITATEPPRPE